MPTRKAASTKVERGKKASAKPKASSSGATTAPTLPDMGNIHLSSALRPGLAQVSAEDFTQRMEALAGQERDAKLAEQGAKVDLAVANAQGVALKAQVANARNLVTIEGINTETANLAIAQLKTEAAQIAADGQAALLPLERQKWSLKAQELSIDNEGQQRLIPVRREFWQAKFDTAQIELKRLQQVAAAKAAELGDGGGVLDGQLL